MKPRSTLAVAALAVAGMGAAMAAGSAVTPRKFNHQAHISRGVKIADACGACHAKTTDGALVPVGEVGHQPCLQAKCHATDFLAVGKRDDKSDRFVRAAGFCLGCHVRVPAPHEKMRAGNAFVGNEAPGYHVELDHFAHTERAKCRDCHRVDEATFALELQTPGHPECATCHGSTASPPMTACAHCHETPGPGEYFAAEDQRPAVGVRSCDSEDHAARVARHGQDVPCFKHERPEHRAKSGRPLQCDQCHYMLSDKSLWTRSARYESLRDIHAAPIIDNRKNEAHARCGDGRSCHARDVSGIGGDCTMCHSRKVASDIF